MNQRPTERIFPGSSNHGEMRHIDLTRRLPSLKSSLTPTGDDDIHARLRRDPIPLPVYFPPARSGSSTFVPALLTFLLILAAIIVLVLAHFPTAFPASTTP